MVRFRSEVRLGWLSSLVALVACGGGGGGSTLSGSDAALSSTLAYTVTACRENPRDGLFFRQEVAIRQGEREPIVALQIPEIGPVPSFGQCRSYGAVRSGPASVLFGAIQRFGVSPDGSAVVVEVSDEFSLLGRFLPPEQQGFFVMRPDGTGRHRIAPASRYGIRIVGGGTVVPLAFSPDGRRFVFPDVGPGPDGEDAGQFVTVDLVDGTRTQVTHLPPAPQLMADFPGLYTPVFVDNETIAFSSAANPEGLNPDHRFAGFTVRLDNFQLKVVPSPIVRSGGIIPTFFITGVRPVAVTYRDPLDLITELFLVDGDNLLQLTNYHRTDTAIGSRGSGAFLGVDGQRVFFNASANPLGTNPSETCQLFSIDRTGADLKQLTFVSESEHARNGCGGGRKPLGCSTRLLGQDRRTETLVFSYTCELFAGRNPNGNQLFAMNPDGTGLRQLTDWRGLVTEPDGTATAELGGPYAYAQSF